MAGQAWIAANALTLAVCPVDGVRAENGCGWAAENAVIAITVYVELGSVWLTETGATAAAGGRRYREGAPCAAGRLTRRVWRPNTSGWSSAAPGRPRPLCRGRAQALSRCSAAAPPGRTSRAISARAEDCSSARQALAIPPAWVDSISPPVTA